MKKHYQWTFVLAAGIFILSNCSPKVRKQPFVESELSKSSSGSNTPVAPSDKPLNSSSSSSSLVASPLVSSSAKKMNDMSMDEQLAFVGQADAPRLQAGKQLFEAKCGQCHDLYTPQSRGRESWVTIMRSMSTKARLSDPEYAQVCAYLVKNARP
jgi:mono/diheme cytochrome c family protein